MPDFIETSILLDYLAGNDDDGREKIKGLGLNEALELRDAVRELENDVSRWARLVRIWGDKAHEYTESWDR